MVQEWEPHPDIPDDQLPEGARLLTADELATHPQIEGVGGDVLVDLVRNGIMEAAMLADGELVLRMLRTD